METREQISYYLLEKKYRGTKREIRLSGFSTARRVAILWHHDDLAGFNHISEFLKKNKAVFRSYCFTQGSNETIANSFSKRDTNFWGFPKKGATDDFMDFDYDILMNISVKKCFELDVLTALTNARFKIGAVTGPVNYFDMAIEIGKNKDSLFLVKQQIHYIEQFNKKK